MDIFELGGHYVTWDGVYPLTTDGYTRPFRRAALPAGLEPIAFHSEFGTPEAFCTAPCLNRTPLGEVYCTDRGRVLVTHMAHLRHAMAAYLDTPMAGHCVLSPRLTERPAVNADVFLTRVGIHRALLARECPVIHAAYVDIGGEALLFTAPSGTGKSTQADLWVTHGGATVINGDRVLLSFEANGHPIAHGFPVCGSSGICLDRSLPVRAVVLLAQGPENVVSEPTVGERVRHLFAAIEVYRWDMNELDAALLAAERMVRAVPVLRLTCRPDREAVEVLCRALDRPLT